MTYVWSESIRKRMKLFRCSRCSFSSSRLFKVKDHLRKAHKTPPRPKPKKEHEDSEERTFIPGSVHPGQLQQFMVAMGLSGLGLGAVPMSALFTNQKPREELAKALPLPTGPYHPAHDFLMLEHREIGEDRRGVSSPSRLSPSPVHQLNKPSHNQVCSTFGEQAVAN